MCIFFYVKGEAEPDTSIMSMEVSSDEEPDESPPKDHFGWSQSLAGFPIVPPFTDITGLQWEEIPNDPTPFDFVSLFVDRHEAKNQAKNKSLCYTRDRQTKNCKPTQAPLLVEFLETGDIARN